jgi:hypothetical protein
VPDYSIPVGSAAQYDDPLGWATINQVQIIFSEDVIVTEDDLALTGTDEPVYDFSDFSYEPSTHTATVTLMADIDIDVLVLTVEDAVTDQALNALDGEWTDGVSTYPSGDGAAGGYFDFKFKVLSGETNHDGQVDGADYTAWADNYQTYQTMYTEADWTADGYVDGADYTVWADHYNDSVPAGAPAGTAARQAAAPAAGDSLDSGADADAFDVAALPAVRPAVLPAPIALASGHLGLPGPGVDLPSDGPQEVQVLLNPWAGRRLRRIRGAGWRPAVDGLDLLAGPSLSVLKPVL